MKYRCQLLFVWCCLAALLAGCSPPGKDAPARDAAAAATPEPESRVQHGTNGEVFLSLDAATQKIMGLQTTSLADAQLSPEIKGYGHVLDPSPLVMLVTDLTTAEAQSAASAAELKRVKTLAAQDNASQRALQSAEAAAVRDLALSASARARLISGWGAIAQRDDLPAFVQSLASLDKALVQIDVPADESTNMPAGARIVTLAQSGNPIPAKFLGPTTLVDPQMQGRGFLFLVSSNASRLLPGAAVTGFLELPGEPQTGVAVPRDAVVRLNGMTWIYVQRGDDRFQREKVELGRPVDNGWFVSKGLRAGDLVVTTGAQELLSEELKGSGD